MLQKGKLSARWEAPPPFCTLHESGECPWGCSCFTADHSPWADDCEGGGMRRLSISSSPCQTCPQSCSKTCMKPGGLLRRSEWQIRFEVLSGMVCPLVRVCLRSDCRYDEELHYLRSPEWTATTFNRNPDRGLRPLKAVHHASLSRQRFSCRETDCTRSLTDRSTAHRSPTRSQSCNLAIREKRFQGRPSK